MRKAALLYNPDSGGSRKRQSELESALAVLRDGGVEADLIATDSPCHAGDEARRAIAAGCDTIFVCGGDGTIQNIAQVLVKSPIAMAVLPMGTANALAHDLGLPLTVVGAAKAALTAVPRRVALGLVRYTDLNGNPNSRYFIVAAGVGADAHLFYKLHSDAKQRIGMAAYYAKAWNLWFTYAMRRFMTEYHELDGTVRRRANITELMAIRIRNFGGVLREFAPGASINRDDLRIIVCRTSSRLVYLAYVVRCLLRLPLTIPGVDLAFASRVSCLEQPAAPGQERQKIYIEADGELLGTLPAELTIVPDALTLLAPRAI